MPTSIFQASLRREPPVESLPTFIVTHTHTSQARLVPVVQSLVHSLHLSYPICHLIWTAQMSRLQGFHPLARPYLTCVTTVNIATRPFTILRRGMLRLPGYPRCYHYGRLKGFFPLRTNGLALPAT
jgi:hypothetical protein